MTSTVANIVTELVGHAYFARTVADKLAFGLFIFGGHLAMWYELFHVLPYYQATSATSTSTSRPRSTSVLTTVHYVVLTTLYFNWLSNLLRMIRAHPCVNYRSMQAKRDATWRYCQLCLGYSPPRSHHCPVCRVCVLRRDHHCWFSGCCVGFHNHRFYLVTVVTIWIAAIYSNIYHWTFVGEQLGGYSLKTLFCICLPHLAALFGFITLYQFFICFLSFLALICLLMFSILVQIQVLQLYNGQMKHERKICDTRYNMGWKSNIQDVIGTRWILIWICPWITSEPPGGFQFRTKHV